MKFAAPYLLNVLWALIPVFGMLTYGILKRKKILNAFASSDMLPVIFPGFDPKRQWIKAALIVIAAGFAIVALGGPQLGYRWEKTQQKGVDIMIALDCSTSMLARDIKPNRLERAKREIIDLLRMMKSDRAGLVAFSGRAVLQCPLTLDHEAFNIFLKVLEPGFLPVGGTNLDAAIKECYEGFEKESDTEKAIIVITDGEVTAGNVDETIQQVAKQGIKVFCIGVGDREGAPIPDDHGGFKKDAAGNIILSKVDEKGLEKLAAITGGAYVRSVAGDMDLDLIYTDRIRGKMERKTLTSGKKKVWENRYQWFLFPGLLFLLVEFFLPSKKLGHKFLILFFAGALSLVLPLDAVHARSVSSSVKDGLQAFEAQNYEQAKKHFIDAQLENPENARLYYNIGPAAYMNKEYDQAKKNFVEAARSTDANLRHDARYNLANTQFRLGNLDEAIAGYEEIIKEFPEDVEAKENLAVAQQKKQEQQQQKSNADPDKKENKDQQDQKQGQNPDKNKNPDRNSDKDPGKDQNKTPDNTPSTDPDRQSEEPVPENKPDNTGQNASPQTAAQDEPGKQAGQNMEKMLNRLEDKPGQAMMPVLQNQEVEKDW